MPTNDSNEPEGASEDDQPAAIRVTGLLDATAASLKAAFEPLRRIPHFGESGRAIEDLLREVLARHLPSRFDLRSGFAIGTDGVVSHQSDILILDALNCPAFLRSRDSGIYPADGVLGSIEVTASLDKAKYEQDRDKIRALRSLFLAHVRLHWDAAPAGFLVGLEGPASLETCAEWLAADFSEAGHEKTWLLPGAILTIGCVQPQRPQGLVCYWDIDKGVETLSFNPGQAHGVCYVESEEDTLALFLHLLMYELRRITEHRLKAVAGNFLLGPVDKPRPFPVVPVEDGPDIDLRTVMEQIVDTYAFAGSHFSDFVSYFPDALSERLATKMKKVE